MSKKKSKTTSRSTATVTPVQPPVANKAVLGHIGNITKFGQADPQSFVAGPSALQTQAFNSTGNLGRGSSLINSGADALRDVVDGGANLIDDGVTIDDVTNVGAASLLDGNIERYLNPFLDGVVETSLADFDEDAGRQRAALAARMAGAGAFGNSRSALLESQFENDLIRGRASTGAGLRYGAYDRATSLADADAARRQQAAIANAQAANARAAAQAEFDFKHLLANQSAEESADNRATQVAALLAQFGDVLSDNERADLETIASLGAEQRAIETDQRLAPLDQLVATGSLLGGSVPLVTGQRTDASGESETVTSPGLLGSIGQGLNIFSAASGLFGRS